jgi:hypothetical protein
MRVGGGRAGEPVAAAVVVTGVWVLTAARTPLSSTGDLAIYARTYRLLEQGAVPYRDVALEYPPFAAALFWVAGMLPGSYTSTFGLLMLGCQVLTALGALSAARALRLGRVHRWTAVALVALTPALIGVDLVAARYDAALAAILAWVTAAAVSSRWTLAWVLVAVGVLLKLTPVLLVPALLVIQATAHRRPGTDTTLGGSVRATVVATARDGFPGWALAGAVLLAGIVPALALSVSGTLRVLVYHAERPLQIESVAASPLLLDHAWRGTDLVQVSSFGSENLAGGIADALQRAGSVAAVLGVLLVAALLAVRLWRAPAGEARAAAAGLGTLALAATIAVAIVTGKVLSPQYLVWLVPLVPLVRGWRGPTGAALLAVAMVLSRLVFPGLYVSLVEELDTLPIALLAVRNALLIGIAVLLVHALATVRPAAATPSA